MTKDSSFNRNIRRVILILSLLAVAIPALARQDQIKDRVKERVQERKDQRGQTPQQGQKGQRVGTPALETQKIAGLDVAIWRPSQSTGAAPLIVFSHGFTGCNTQSAFLMEAMADAGYLVLAPNHKDAKCGRLPIGKPEEGFGRPGAWTASTYDDRRDDIMALVDALRRDRQWSSQIDWNRVGLAGHSLGGYTVLGLAGAWPSWKMASIKAVLALSPYCQPFIQKGNLSGISIPVMYQGGTRDPGITPFVKRAGGCYPKTSSPATFVEFTGAGHFAWTNVMSTYHGLIIRYSLAFLDKNLRGISGASFTVRQSGVSTLLTK
jgi:predicted dienelactone hydrolase